MNNIGDGIDLDYCRGTFINNKLIFENYEGLNNIETDGLDISGTDIKIKENIFENFSDKGISVGERSYPLISMNTFTNNNMALAIKKLDCKSGKNIFNDNNEDISLYVKKRLYGAPKVILNKDNTNLNIKNIKEKLLSIILRINMKNLQVKRQELKYYVNLSEADRMRGLFSKVLCSDKSPKYNNGYLVSSLYFESYDDRNLDEKLDGILSRESIEYVSIIKIIH